MGLDGVEFIMAVEERFGIAIPDSDAQQLTTPRVVIDYIAARITLIRFAKAIRQFVTTKQGLQQDLRWKTICVQLFYGIAVDARAG